MSDETARNLPGYLKKSFKMAYAGGEIWFEHLDGMYEHSGLVLEKLAADTPVFRRPSYPSAVAVVLDETVLTNEIISRLTDSLILPGKRFARVAFVGADRIGRRRLKRSLSSAQASFSFSFFDDLERSKEWPVSESY